MDSRSPTAESEGDGVWFISEAPFELELEEPLDREDESGWL